MPPKFECQTAGVGGMRVRGLSRELKISDNVVGELKVTCCSILHSCECFGCEEQCVLCASSLGGRPIASLQPAGADWQNKTPMCVLPWVDGECVSDPMFVRTYSFSIFNPCQLTFNASAHRNLTSCGHFSGFIWELCRWTWWMEELSFTWKSG